MKGRDFLILTAVVLIAGFAAADELRNRAASEPTTTATREPTTTAPSRRAGPRPQPDPPVGYPIGTLAGTVVFTDARSCRIRVIELAGGRERRLPRIGGNCELWAAPVSQKIAYGLGSARGGDAAPFRFIDLARPSRELGGFAALFGFLVWSLDGQRAAWCGRSGVGFDVEVGGRARRLASCPAAYTPAGEVAVTLEDRLVVGDRAVLRTDGDITFARWGTDGSVAVMVDGRSIERWEAGTRTAVVRVALAYQGRLPVLSPDNCAAVLTAGERARIFDIGCFRGNRRAVFEGSAVAWSPDGKWIAVAQPGTIAFHRVVGPEQTIRWPAAAVELAWRPR